MHNQFSWDVFKKYFTQILTPKLRNITIFQSFKMILNCFHKLFFIEPQIKICLWKRLSYVFLIGSKVMHHCWQSQWPKSCTWFIKMPWCLTVKKKWWNGRKSLGTLIQNTNVSFHTFVADLCKNMISSGIYFQGLIWKFCFGKRFWSTNAGGAGVKPLLRSVNIVICQGKVRLS